MKKRALIMNDLDNVVTVLEDVKKGETICFKVAGSNRTVKAIQSIARGHKIAIKTIERGEKVIKYGVPVGYAMTHIGVGEHVHVHNTASLRTEGGK